LALLATHTGHPHEAGLDEAGRGCLAGPVFAAAVILPPDFNPPFLNDSKQLTARRREVLRALICAEAVAWAVGEASAAEITALN
ncbi:ribonuclease HII, partial [Klebsiella pneumoniae]